MFGLDMLATVLSVLSLALGIGNTLYIYFWETRVHLYMTVGVRRVFNAAGVETDDRIMRWTLTNKSAFPVYISEIGFCDYTLTTFQEVPHAFIRTPDHPEAAVEFPYKLNSREGITFKVTHSSQREVMKEYSDMYVRTCCGYKASAKVPYAGF